MIYEDSISRALCGLSSLCHISHSSHHRRTTDIYKDEHRRMRCDQVHHDAYRRMPIHDWCHHPVPCFLRL